MRSYFILKMFLAVLLIMTQTSPGAANLPNTAATPLTELQPARTLDTLDANVSLRTPADSGIMFRSERELRENRPDRMRKIPHLVLKRNGVLTPAFERTLLLSVSQLAIPRSGLFLELTIETQHGDPDPGREQGRKIAAWRQRRLP